MLMNALVKLTAVAMRRVLIRQEVTDVIVTMDIMVMGLRAQVITRTISFRNLFENKPIPMYKIVWTPCSVCRNCKLQHITFILQ